HVVVGGGEEFLAEAGPFFGDDAEFGVAAEELEVPALPIALHEGDLGAVGGEDTEGAAEGEDLRLKIAEQDAVRVEDVDFRAEERDAAFDAEEEAARLRVGRLVDREARRHEFLV